VASYSDLIWLPVGHLYSVVGTG